MQRISAGPCQTVPRQRFYETLGSSELISFETFFSFFIKHSKSAVLTAGMHRVLPGRHEFPTVHGWGGGFPGCRRRCEPPAPPCPSIPRGAGVMLDHLAASRAHARGWCRAGKGHSCQLSKPQIFFIFSPLTHPDFVILPGGRIPSAGAALPSVTVPSRGLGGSWQPSPPVWHL